MTALAFGAGLIIGGIVTASGLYLWWASKWEDRIARCNAVKTNGGLCHNFAMPGRARCKYHSNVPKIG